MVATIIPRTTSKRRRLKTRLAALMTELQRSLGGYVPLAQWVLLYCPNLVAEVAINTTTPRNNPPHNAVDCNSDLFNRVRDFSPDFLLIWWKRPCFKMPKVAKPMLGQHSQSLLALLQPTIRWYPQNTQTKLTQMDTLSYWCI